MYLAYIEMTTGGQTTKRLGSLYSAQHSYPTVNFEHFPQHDTITHIRASTSILTGVLVHMIMTPNISLWIQCSLQDTIQIATPKHDSC